MHVAVVAGVEILFGLISMQQWGIECSEAQHWKVLACISGSNRAPGGHANEPSNQPFHVPMRLCEDCSACSDAEAA